MKKYFLTGFITLLPIALTLIIVSWLFHLFTAPLAGITEYILLASEKKLGLSLEHHDKLVLFLSRVFALIILLILIFLLGFCGRRFLNKFFSKIADRIFSHIPLVRTIYRLSNDITKAVFAENKKTFKETVLVPFPHHDALAIGLVTGESPAIFNREGIPKTDLAVFVPTAPHPMSGFVLLTPKKMVFPVDVTVEDAFKFLISCGVMHPGERINTKEQEK
jgi:uncharacterized membrane protein